VASVHDVDIITGQHQRHLADLVAAGDVAAVDAHLKEIFARGGQEAVIREATCREFCLQDTRIVSSPLHLAASRGESEILRLLLATKADPNLQNDAGDTLLHAAASTGREEAIAELLRAGANPKLKNNFGRSAEEFASPQPWDTPRTRDRKVRARQAIACAAGASQLMPPPAGARAASPL